MAVPKQMAVRAVDSWPPAETDLLAEMYEAHGPRLLALCRRRLGDPRLAEDALHEALIKAYRAQGSYRAEQPMWPWLATIARNVCTDMQRRQSRVVPVECDRLDGPVIDDDPDETADRAVRRQLLVDALTSLPIQYRRPVYLKHIEGWTYEQIAAHDHTSLAAVRTRLLRGRRELRARVEDLARRRGQWPLPALAPLAWLRLRAVRARALLLPAEGGLGPVLANLAPFAFAAVLATVPAAGAPAPSQPPPSPAAMTVAYRADAFPPATLSGRGAPASALAPAAARAIPAPTRIVGLTPEANAVAPVPVANQSAVVELGPAEIRCGEDGGPVTAAVCAIAEP
jgi:RNA polymerase sigma-70 factor (ECF subfamily)